MCLKKMRVLVLNKAAFLIAIKATLSVSFTAQFVTLVLVYLTSNRTSLGKSSCHRILIARITFNGLYVVNSILYRKINK